jgi:DNA-binding IscR family transcriptional regulator
MLHVLLHMARHEGPMTSEAIAAMLGTNPVVVRRTMAGLREAGYVRSDKGHGGGWAIAADLGTVSLLDIHRAVGGPRIFAIGNDRPHPDCAVEKVVNAAIEEALAEAEALLIARLGRISLAELARSFDAHCAGAADCGVG